MNRLLQCLNSRTWSAIICLCTCQGSLADESFLLSTSGSGRASGYCQSNKIITAAGKTHVAWQDVSQRGFEIKIRTFDHEAHQWSPSYTIGEAFDNHGGPAMVIDSKGYLHVVYYPHSHPMRYRKSVRPHDASEWSEEIQFGERLTYPTLVIGPDDTLYMTARCRGEDKKTKWTLQFFSKPDGGDWSAPTPLIEPSEALYAQYQVALAWGPDHKTLHLSTRLYGDMPRWGYLVGYMKSTDFGKTWQRFDGTPIPLPANKETLDPVEVTSREQRANYESASSLYCGAIAVDAQNTPHILYNTLPPDAARVRQTWIGTPNKNGGWKKTLLNDKIDVLPEGWGLAMGAGLVISEGQMTAVLLMADDSNETTLWGAPSSQVVWARSTDSGQTFESEIISRQNTPGPNWLPNIEKPTGFNQVAADPNVNYLSGERGVNNHAILTNNVYLWTKSLRLAPR